MKKYERDNTKYFAVNTIKVPAKTGTFHAGTET